MIKYKIDIIKELKNKGYTTYYILKNKIIPQGTMTAIREGKYISLETLDKLCTLLDCNVEEIIECVKK